MEFQWSDELFTYTFVAQQYNLMVPKGSDDFLSGKVT